MDHSRREMLGTAVAGGFGAFLAGFPGTGQARGGGRDVARKSGLRIAVVQQETLPGEVETNRKKALAFAAEALRNGPDIILFHEALLTGYTERVQTLAEETTGPTTQAFRQLLRGSDPRVLYGLVERQGGNVYTAATLVGSAGVLANYRKTHLWWKTKGVRHEPTYFKPGNRLVTFDLKGWKCGVMICYDGDFPEMARAYANRDCVVLFWLNNRGSRGKDEVVRLARSNSMIMATSCCCGRNDTDQLSRGGSNIVSLDGTVLAEIWDQEGVIYADVDPSRVMAARDQNPGYRGQRPELYR